MVFALFLAGWYPETKSMLEDIRSGHISALIFSKLARLARNTKELLEFAEIFRECNADLISLAESIDTSALMRGERRALHCRLGDEGDKEPAEDGAG